MLLAICRHDCRSVTPGGAIDCQLPWWFESSLPSLGGGGVVKSRCMLRTNQSYVGGGSPVWCLVCQWLGVTRASDPPVPCGHRLSYCSNVSTWFLNGMASCVAPN